MSATWEAPASTARASAGWHALAGSTAGLSIIGTLAQAVGTRAWICAEPLRGAFRCRQERDALITSRSFGSRHASATPDVLADARSPRDSLAGPGPAARPQ